MPKKKQSFKLTEHIEDEDKRKTALDAALKQIEKNFGEGSIMKLGQRPKMEIEVVSSGSLLLDSALGVGGYPKGRIIEIYGAESSGKTTLTLHAIAECQKAGGVCAFIDAEHALDPEYARKLGVNIDELLISQPDTGEQALEICDTLVSSGGVDMVVVDSVAALVPKAELDAGMGDPHMALQARLMSQAMRKLAGVINSTKTIAFFINQVRVNIGAYSPTGQPPTTTAGGRALKFYSTLRLEIKKGDRIKDGDEIIGNETKVKVVKNKVAPPFKEVVLTLIFGEGLSAKGEMFALAVDYEIIEKRGGWYYYEGERLGQGMEKAKACIAENPDIEEEIMEKIRNLFKNGLPTNTTSSSDSEEDDD